jgi:hypothetical protein
VRHAAFGDGARQFWLQRHCDRLAAGVGPA